LSAKYKIKDQIEEMLNFVLGFDALLLLIGLFQSNTCHYITTTRGLSAYIIVVSLLVLPFFIIALTIIIELINKWRKSLGMEKIQMNSGKIVEMTFASTGRSMKF
jgi:hypothetical protein